MNSPLRIIVNGLIAQHYTLGGVTWDYLQYLIGLKQLGHDVYYLEDSGEWPYNTDGGISGNDWVARDCDKNINYLNKVLSRYGFEDRWSYFFPPESKWYGLPNSKRKSIIASADLLINVSGALAKPSKYESVKKLIYIDSDPGFTQVKLKLKLKKFIKRVAAHQVHFSFGENLPDELTTDSDYNWIPTRTPIVLSEWKSEVQFENVYTTIMNWTSYRSRKYKGKIYGQKDIEFVKFIELKNKLKNIDFEVAMTKLSHKNWESAIEHLIPEYNIDIHNSFKNPADLLSHYGWKIVDAEEKCGDIDSYRKYIFHSKGEWSVSKSGYVTSKPGWFSCRSACYLAAGKPVIVQDTGFDKVIPVGEGVLQFSTMEEATEAIREVEARYGFHSKRALEIADEYFDSAKVLKKLIEQSFSNSNIKQITS